MCGFSRGIVNLDQEIIWASQHVNGHRLQHPLYKLVIAATLYHVRLERNSMLFKNIPRDVLCAFSVACSDLSYLSL